MRGNAQGPEDRAGKIESLRAVLSVTENAVSIEIGRYNSGEINEDQLHQYLDQVIKKSSQLRLEYAELHRELIDQYHNELLREVPHLLGAWKKLSDASDNANIDELRRLSNISKLIKDKIRDFLSSKHQEFSSDPHLQTVFWLKMEGKYPTISIV